MTFSLIYYVVFYFTVTLVFSKNSDIEEAKEFMKKTDTKDIELNYGVADTEYIYNTNLTDFNKEEMEKVNKIYGEFHKKAIEEAKKFDWESFKDKNAMLHRWFKLFLMQTDDNGVQNYEITHGGSNSNSRSNGEEEKTMTDIFNEAKVCPFKSKERGSSTEDNCTLTLNNDLDPIFMFSRDPEELKFYWKEYRDATGKKMRDIFIKQVKDSNEASKKKGYEDTGAEWVALYESKTFKEDMAKLMAEIKPLYQHVHAYVRRRLVLKYGDEGIEEDGPIPAHLLGHMYSQSWLDIFDLVNPYPGQTIPNITKILVKKKYKQEDMMKMADKFYISIGLEKMTPEFWNKSVYVKPPDVEMACHPFANTFFNKKDFRIRMCARVRDEDMYIMYHEMGHIQYYMTYRNLPLVFQASANPGFHEAIGDAMVLSITTLDYLQEVGFVDKCFKMVKETNISFLLKQALKFLVKIPYCYMLDIYRYAVYNGTIKEEELNKMYWQYRSEYQGVCPPVDRTEEDWDPGAKMHVANIIEYMRYYVSSIFSFQIHESLCKVAGVESSFEKCNIHKNKEAGEVLRKLLAVGKTKHWRKVMKDLTRGETSTLDAKPLLRYFEPLLEWLKSVNKGHTVGWKHDDVMSCKKKGGRKSSTHSGIMSNKHSTMGSPKQRKMKGKKKSKKKGC